MMLVCKIILTGTLRDAIEFGISAEDFTTSEAQAIYKRLLGVYQSTESSGSVIGPSLAKKEFPNLPWAQVDEHVTTEHLFHEVRKGRLSSMLSTTMVGAAQTLQTGDLQAAISQIKMCMQQIDGIEVSRNHDVYGAKGFERALQTYDRRKSGEDKGVMQWAWYELTKHAGPIMEDDYIIFYGRPKTMKSWLLLYQATEAVLGQNVPVTIYTKEMTPDNLYQRMASIVAEVPYGDARLGALVPVYEKKFREAMRFIIEELKQREKDNLLWVLSGKDMGGRDTISWLRSKLERYKPAACFIDGLYLMSPENQKLVKTNDRLQEVSRAARQMVLDLKVPILATLQANRKAAGHEKGEMDEIAMSDAFSQDCTAAIRTVKDKTKQPDGQQTISCVVAGSREWDLDGFRVYGEPSTNFNFHSYLDDSELAAIKAQDDAEAAAGEKKKGGRPAVVGGGRQGKASAEDIRKVADQFLEQTG